ncbi:hypothetical protein GCM10027066_16470 [Dyella jejuensis]
MRKVGKVRYLKMGALKTQGASGLLFTRGERTRAMKIANVKCRALTLPRSCLS